MPPFSLPSLEHTHCWILSLQLFLLLSLILRITDRWVLHHGCFLRTIQCFLTSSICSLRVDWGWEVWARKQIKNCSEVLWKSDLSVFLFICCAYVNSVTPSPPQARVCPPHMLPEDGANLSSARGILSLIQSSTRRAYQQILDVLDENRRWLVAAALPLCCICFGSLFSGLWCCLFVCSFQSFSKMLWFEMACFLSFHLKLLSKIHISQDYISFAWVMECI